MGKTLVHLPATLSSTRRQRGVALVLVLAFLVLITGLVLAFFSSVTTELGGVKRYASGATTKQLADSTTQLVMGAIRVATSKGNTYAWASQPGMIRTYDNGGSPADYYKLYSSDNMVVTPSQTAAFDPAADVDAAWDKQPSLFSDLNAPVSVSFTDSTGKPVVTESYPIVDPAAAGIGPSPGAIVQGFSIGKPPGASTNAAPMPVKWIYVLQDGALTVPTGVDPSDSSGKTATWATPSPFPRPTPSATNPIVGRIAFWTDDETSKVNINTAAGDLPNPGTVPSVGGHPAVPAAGAFWDIPRCTTYFERDSLAVYQPVQKEYQRYPGHPATVSLATVFPTITSRTDLFSIVPRIIGGGSDGGTKIPAAAAAGGGYSLTLDSDRLYASIDELLFQPATASGQRRTNPLTKTDLEKSNFFITATSRAPEVNLFNKPRVAIWPVNSDLVAKRPASSPFATAYDQLIAFCAHTGLPSGGYDYFFQRSDPTSPKNDYDGIPRNKNLISYLQGLAGKEIPGFGGSFLAKYPASSSSVKESDQILTEIFDYIRSTNLNDTNIVDTAKRYTPASVGHGVVAPIQVGSTMGFGRFLTISEVGLAVICTADGKPNGAVPNPSNVPTNKTLGPAPAPLLAADQKRIEAILLLEPFSVGQGWEGANVSWQIQVDGLNLCTINGTSLGFPNTGLLKCSVPSYGFGRNWGGTFGPRFLFVGSNASTRLPARGVMPADSGYDATIPNFAYPFVSIPITINSATSTMTFSGKPIVIKIFSGTAGSALVQTLNVDLSLLNGPWPIPNIVTSQTTAATAGIQSWWTFSRDGAMPGSQGRVFYQNTRGGDNQDGSIVRGPNLDVMRSMVPGYPNRAAGDAHAGGDYRLIAALQNVPSSLWVPHRFAADPTKFLAHNFTDCTGNNLGFDGLTGCDYGRIINVPSGPYGNGFLDCPSAPVAVAAANPWRAEVTGDFDNGVSFIPDGSFINKPDEGNLNQIANYSAGDTSKAPYFDNSIYAAATSSYSSPNRMIPSPGMFGSLSTGVQRNRPWETLLFRPQPDHPNAAVPATAAMNNNYTKPPDHLLMDWFWMPVVEPYAVSEPLSTAGKINLNYQIAPFTYIRRSTAVEAALCSERVLAIPTNRFDVYKFQYSDPGGYHTQTDFRFDLNLSDVDGTLRQFRERFTGTTSSPGNDLFRSPTEICDIYLVPKGERWTSTNMNDDANSFWRQRTVPDIASGESSAYLGFKLTGDNSRERPYADIYAHLTTKSNTYTIHMRVQSLQKVPGTSAALWVDGKDQVTSEYRGSALIERFIDPSDPDLPDFATGTGGNSARFPNSADRNDISNYYQFRIVSTKKFSP